MESDLIHRLENATEGQERELLWDVFLAVNGPRPPSNYDPRAWKQNKPEFSTEWTKYIGVESRFTAMLDAKAWTSAAEMLVPEGWYYAVATDSAGAMAAVEPVPDCDEITIAPFPWAALAAASVKARG